MGGKVLYISIGLIPIYTFFFFFIFVKEENGHQRGYGQGLQLKGRNMIDGMLVMPTLREDESENNLVCGFDILSMYSLPRKAAS